MSLGKPEIERSDIMAFINLDEIQKVDRDKLGPQKTVYATYCVIEQDDEKYVQISTNSSKDKLDQGNSSQNIVFDHNSAKFFDSLFKETFNDLNSEDYKDTENVIVNKKRNMTIDEFAKELSKMYSGEDIVSKTTAIHMFGLKYADELEASGINKKDILQAAGMPDSYETEINKGIRIYKSIEKNEFGIKFYEGENITNRVADSEDIQEAFKVWALTQKSASGNNYSEGTINNYCHVLRNLCTKFGVGNEIGYTNLFAIKQVKIFTAVKNFITSKDGFAKFNKDWLNNASSAALALYEKFLQNEDEAEWVPSLEEYNPNLSKEQWLELLKDGSTFTKNAYVAIARMYDCDGIASCQQLANKYGETAHFYNGALGVQLPSKVRVKFDVPYFVDKDGENRVWPILFQGRSATNGEKGTFVWKIRDELYDALTEFDIKRYLYENITWSKYQPTENLIHNQIIFGAPGTGKSHKIEEGRKTQFKDNYERVTFHPDYTYANFVGAYKPVSVDDDISYEYVPGPFMTTFVKAVKSLLSDTPERFLLIIEEINRANMAAVFGDIFQLLDRNAEHVSEYSITTTQDMRKYLMKELNCTEDVVKEIKIPSNMYIWATMNSADQGVFPMDTAFKRRWNFEYLDIDDGEDGMEEFVFEIEVAKEILTINWNKLRHAINKRLTDMGVNEDKLLGPYFIAKSVMEGDNDGFVDAFKNKVLMYLYEDAAKHKRDRIFAVEVKDKYDKSIENKRYSQILKNFNEFGLAIFVGNSFNEAIVKTRLVDFLAGTKE